MTGRAAIVTGGSSGIGLEIARMLGQEGHGVTVAARNADKLALATEQLSSEGFDVIGHVADFSGADSEAVVKGVISAHRERFGRLDVLVNNVGVGMSSPIENLKTSSMDVQLNLNLRVIPLFYREALDMLRAAAVEHRTALVVNTSSIAGKYGEANLSIYSAAKAGVIGFTQAMNRELRQDGIKSTALCPAYVDTAMTEFAKQTIPAESMITTQDVAELVRTLLKLSPGCLIPELVMTQPGDYNGMGL